MTTTDVERAVPSMSILSPHDVGELADVVRDAVDRRAPLRLAGAGTWLDAGRPVRADATLSLAGLRGIVEYVPGDLTLTARAGTPLADIARATAEHGQWLTLDPYGGDVGTIGATVATASAGPLAHHFGTPRDIVLGVEWVTGTGAVVRGGGRVVKNVAGFDLVRLVTGAWGSLGAITELTVRLRARPMVDTTLAVRVDATRPALVRLEETLRGLPFVPMAAELLSGPLAARVVPGVPAEDAALLVRLGGNEAAVRDQRERILTIGEAREMDASVWTSLRAGEPAGAAVVRLSQRPARFPETWLAAGRIQAAWPGALVHGDPGRGVVRCILPPGGGSATALERALALPFDGTRVHERLPAALWPALAPGRVADRLSRGIKEAYDPHDIMNPGILGARS